MKDAETIYTDSGATLVLTERQDQKNLLVLDGKSSFGVEIELDDDTIAELIAALEEIR